MTQKELQLINFFHYLNTHPWVMVLCGALMVWTLVWKGLALWKAAKTGRNDWYILLLVVNTLGILEIIYLLFFSRQKQS
jgi:hypothetical protein